MQKNDIAETVIGAIVVALAIIFLAFAYLRSGSVSTSGYEVNARMSKVDGLGIGTDVRLAGIKIGSGLRPHPGPQDLSGHGAYEYSQTEYKVPADSSLKLATQSSLLGGWYLSVTPGGDDKMLAPGGYFDNVQGTADHDEYDRQRQFGRQHHQAGAAAKAGAATIARRTMMRRTSDVPALAALLLGASFPPSLARRASRRRASRRRPLLASPPPAANAPDPAAAPDVGDTTQPLQPAGPMILLLRGLDKITGRPTDIIAPVGKPVHFASLTITARSCYSTPASETPETAAFVQIDEHRPDQAEKRILSGWMYASSPGLNAVQHPLYDVWVINCRTNAPGMTPKPANASTAPVKVASPDSSDKEAVPVLPAEAGK